jgi:hypothetical protein
MKLNTVLLASGPDEKHKQTFLTHLSVYERSGVLSLWHAGMVFPGGYWQAEMAQHIGDAHLVLALISRDFIASDNQVEYFGAALRRQEQGLCRTVSVLLSPCMWEDALTNTPTIILPRNHEEITTWNNRAAAYKQVGKELKEVIESVSRRFLA